MADASTDGTFGRFVEPPLEAMTKEQRDAYDYTVRERSMIPGPYKIWLCNPDLETAMVPVGSYYQNKLSLSPAEREIVNNMINGYWAAAAYSNYEHELLGQKAGLPADKVAALVAGLPVTFEDERQQVVHDVAASLIARRRMPQHLFERAVRLLGDAGLCDVTVLIGYFTSVSLSLVAYDVPSHATGLERKDQPK